MKKFLFINVAIVALLLSSCSTKSTDNRHASEVELEEVAPYLIPLDSVTRQHVGYLQSIDDRTIAFFNRPSYEICIVNLDSMTTKKQKVFYEGPNSVPQVDAFYYLSPDSIWLFESWGSKMTLIDSTGAIIGKTEIPKTNKDGSLPKYTVTPYATTSMPYSVRGNAHILQGFCGMPNEGQIPGVTVIYDAANDTLITGNPYPDVYGKAEELLENWSPLGFLPGYYAISPNGSIITSFPASDSLYVYNPNTGERKAYFAGYSSPTNIKPRTAKGGDSESIHYLTSYNYGGILYDDTENLYYRILRLPTKDFDQEQIDDEITRKKCAVIILDSDFSIIGETILPEDTYYPTHIFVNSDGLHINALSDDDDFMKFRTFKIKK